MVLQQKTDAKLWGWSDPNGKIFITTSWNNKTDSTTATRDAKWQISVPTPAAGGPFTITIKGDNNTITITNVMIGEVWVCSGQSNMEMSGNWGLKDIKDELPTAYNSNIRFMQIPKSTSQYPQDDVPAKWTICDSNTLKSFSAAGYFFGKRLSSYLNTPIGLINSSWGGTPAEVWTPDSVVKTNPVLAEAAAKLEPQNWWPHLPGSAYNAMIAPLTQYNIAGAIWYQGESNTKTASTYSELFTGMIKAWRVAFKKDIPFYYVQIAPFKYGDKNVAALLREAQTKSMQLANTGMVVTTDITADTNDIHPINKHDVGLRLANWALAETYHQTGITYNNVMYKMAYKSPMYASLDIDKSKAIVSFNTDTKKLASKGKLVTDVFVAGADKIFYPATATIKDNKLVATSKQVKNPVAVRYAFSNTGSGNIFSAEGLPVVPFRTDDWEVETK